MYTTSPIKFPTEGKEKETILKNNKDKEDSRVVNEIQTTRESDGIKSGHPKGDRHQIIKGLVKINPQL